MSAHDTQVRRTTPSTGDPETTDIQMSIRVRPKQCHSCPLASFASSGEDRQCREESENVNEIVFTKQDDSCLVNFLMENGEVLARRGKADSATCLCDVFFQSGCVPRFTAIEDGEVHVTTHVETRSQIEPLIADLKSATEAVAMDRLVSVDSENSGDVVLFDRSVLTQKQREAVELAIKRDYYTSDTQLEELAEALGIGQSALSERIRTAHAKLIEEVFPQ